MNFIVIHMNDPWEIIVNLTYIVLSVGVTLIFWFKDSNIGFKHIAVSAHSFLLLIIIGASLIFGYNGIASGSYIWLLLSILCIPIISVVFSLIYFTDSKWWHFLHIWNVFAICWTYFIGGMSVTGDWL